jgi:hypothetical protein
MKPQASSLALLLLAGTLAGCAKPAQTSQASGTSPSTVLAQRDTSACNMPGGWSFVGSCATGKMSGGGTRYVLRPDRGVGVTLAFGPNDSNGSVFIIGTATGRGDIGGSLNDRLPFPRYGSVPCIDPSDRPIACAGAALIYVLIINAGTPVKFAATPLIVVTRDEAFASGQTCHSNTLVPDSYASQGAAYIARPPDVEARGKAVSFASSAQPQTYGGGGSVVTFAITCR